MSDDQFDAILRHTLEDFRVSRGEKRILQSTLQELHADEQDLALYRHRAFEIARNELMSPEAKAVLDWLEDVNKVLKPTQTKSDLPEGDSAFLQSKNVYHKYHQTLLLFLQRIVFS